MSLPHSVHNPNEVICSSDGSNPPDPTWVRVSCAKCTDGSDRFLPTRLYFRFYMIYPDASGIPFVYGTDYLDWDQSLGWWRRQFWMECTHECNPNPLNDHECLFGMTCWNGEWRFMFRFDDEEFYGIPRAFVMDSPFLIRGIYFGKINCFKWFERGKSIDRINSAFDEYENDIDRLYNDLHNRLNAHLARRNQPIFDTFIPYPIASPKWDQTSQDYEDAITYLFGTLHNLRNRLMDRVFTPDSRCDNLLIADVSEYPDLLDDYPQFYGPYGDGIKYLSRGGVFGEGPATGGYDTEVNPD